MNVNGERVIIFGDSLSHQVDSAPEIWNVDQASGRISSQPGDLLASMLAEQGAAVRVNACAGRSAHNFFGQTSQTRPINCRENAQALLASDAAFKPGRRGLGNRASYLRQCRVERSGGSCRRHDARGLWPGFYRWAVVVCKRRPSSSKSEATSSMSAPTEPTRTRSTAVQAPSLFQQAAHESLCLTVSRIGVSSAAISSRRHARRSRIPARSAHADIVDIVVSQITPRNSWK